MLRQILQRITKHDLEQELHRFGQVLYREYYLFVFYVFLKGLSHEIDFKKIDKNLHNKALKGQ